MNQHRVSILLHSINQYVIIRNVILIRMNHYGALYDHSFSRLWTFLILVHANFYLNFDNDIELTLSNTYFDDLE